MDVIELKRHQLSHSQRHPWEIVRAKIIIFLLGKYNVQSPKRILEIGSGDAFISNQLSAIFKTASIHAVDTAYTEEIIRTLQKNSSYPISFYNKLSDFSTNNQPADLIVLADVLEHIENDRGFFESAIHEKVSTPNATLMVTVPAFQSLFSQHDRQLNHFRRYNRRQLTSVCTTSGVHALASGYFFFSLFIVRWLSVHFQKSTSYTTRSIDNWRGGKLVTNFISFILWMDFKVCFILSRLGITLPGLSCYCLCRKSPS